MVNEQDTEMIAAKLKALTAEQKQLFPELVKNTDQKKVFHEMVENSQDLEQEKDAQEWWVIEIYLEICI